MPTAKKTAIKKVVKKTTAVKKTAPAKKTAAKAVSKKNLATKQAEKSAKKKIKAAKPEKCFWVNDGKILADLLDLEAAFGSMAETVFVHHVTKEKNDFADWVEHVLEDVDCAADLRTCRKPRSAKTVVVRHLKRYQQ